MEHFKLLLPLLILVLSLRFIELEYHHQPNQYKWPEITEEIREAARAYYRRIDEKTTITFKHEVEDPLENALQENSGPIANDVLYKDQPLTCSSMGDCVPANVVAPRHYTVSLRYSMNTCLVQKSMSTVMAAIFCYLDRSEEYERENRSIIYDHGETKFCGDSMTTHSMRQLQRIYNFRVRDRISMPIVMVTRDPMERLISGFVDRCIRGVDDCFGCHRNLVCFMERLHERLIEFGRYGDTIHHVSDLDLHFFPQNWRCDIADWKHKFVYIKYSADPVEVMDRLDEILEKRHVSQHELDFIRREVVSTRTFHSTLGTPIRSIIEKRIKKSPYLTALLVKMFYHDYKEFNYPLPTVQ